MPNYSSFKIRSYGRMELASLYSPDLTGMSAYRKRFGSSWMPWVTGPTAGRSPHWK